MSSDQWQAELVVLAKRREAQRAASRRAEWHAWHLSQAKRHQALLSELVRWHKEQAKRYEA